MTEITKYKIVFIGDSFVGKTSIIKKLISNEFKNNISPTIGALYQSYKPNDNTIFEIWDVAGHDRFVHLLSKYYSIADYIILTYDISEISTINKIKTIIDIVNNDMKILDPKYILVGNKVDRLNYDEEEIKIRTEFVNNEIKDFFIIDRITTSAKDGINIQKIINIILDNIENKKIKNELQNKIMKQKNYQRFFSLCSIL
jgi:small GTP-binding protein